MSERSDEFLVTASRTGDRPAYAELFRRHSRRVWAVCMGMLGNAADSDDISQETFTRGFTSLGALRSGDSFGPWITSVARNLCRDYIRVSARRRELVEQNAREDSGESADYSALHEALAELPEQYRTPLMLFYFDGKSAKRLAGELGISHDGACTRLSRARRELRRILEKRDGSR
ncbi:MAG: sigma-70 family RNA polymerase sigma factor [Candidatus Krumholzibacteria bacterium]|nr:sigma-70 family RNA polymerase sigma factor [Candidatus Krumholzibacteria bacterium]